MNPFIDPAFDPIYAAQPIVLVDVGARGGLRRNWFQAQHHLHHIAVEPEPEEYRRLVASAGSKPYRSTVLGVALHREPAQLDLHVAKSGGLSSIFRPNATFLQSFPDEQRFETRQVSTVQADTLDHQLRLHGVDDVDFIKIDTQGSELFVLQGAAGVLETSVVGVEVEVSFTSLYVDQPLFADVDVLLRQAGFDLFDLRPCYWKRRTGPDVGGPRGQIIWADALYLKRPPALERLIAALPAERRQGKGLKAISTALLYGYGDFALELARTGQAWLAPDAQATVERRIRQELATTRQFSFPGRAQLAAICRRLSRRLQPPGIGWSVSRGELGNLD